MTGMSSNAAPRVRTGFKSGPGRIRSADERRVRAAVRRRNARGASGGFTLIEMVVAAIVLFIGVTAAMVCISSATRATGIATEYQTASLLAQQRIAEIESQPDTELSGGSHSGNF